MEDIIYYIDTQVNGAAEKNAPICCILPENEGITEDMAGIETASRLPRRGNMRRSHDV
jgi:hypothetical protein